MFQLQCKSHKQLLERGKKKKKKKPVRGPTQLILLAYHSKLKIWIKKKMSVDQKSHVHHGGRESGDSINWSHR